MHSTLPTSRVARLWRIRFHPLSKARLVARALAFFCLPDPSSCAPVSSQLSDPQQAGSGERATRLRRSAQEVRRWPPVRLHPACLLLTSSTISLTASLLARARAGEASSSANSSNRKRKQPAMSDRETSAASGASTGGSGASSLTVAATASGAAGSSSGGSSGEPPRRTPSAEAAAEQEALERLEESAAANAQSWGAPSSALQGLLRKLGAGLDDLLPSISASHSKLKVILSGLKTDDEGRQLVALNELCELLSIGARRPAPHERIGGDCSESPPPVLHTHLDRHRSLNNVTVARARVPSRPRQVPRTRWLPCPSTSSSLCSCR